MCGSFSSPYAFLVAKLCSFILPQTSQERRLCQAIIDLVLSIGSIGITTGAKNAEGVIGSLHRRPESVNITDTQFCHPMQCTVYGQRTEH